MLRQTFYPTLYKVLKQCEPLLQLELQDSTSHNFLLLLRALLPTAGELHTCRTHNPRPEDVMWFSHVVLTEESGIGITEVPGSHNLKACGITEVPGNLKGVQQLTSPCKNAGCPQELCGWYQKTQHPSQVPRRLLLVLADLTNCALKWLQAKPGTGAKSLSAKVLAAAEQMDELMKCDRMNELGVTDVVPSLAASWKQDSILEQAWFTGSVAGVIPGLSCLSDNKNKLPCPLLLFRLLCAALSLN